MRSVEYKRGNRSYRCHYQGSKPSNLCHITHLFFARECFDPGTHPNLIDYNRVEKMDGKCNDIHDEPLLENKFIASWLCRSWSSEIYLIERVPIYNLKENIIQDSSREKNKAANSSQHVMRCSSRSIKPSIILRIVTHSESSCQSKFDYTESSQTHIAKTYSIQNDIQSHKLGYYKCLTATWFVVKDIWFWKHHLMNQCCCQEYRMNHEQEFKQLSRWIRWPVDRYFETKDRGGRSHRRNNFSYHFSWI